MLRLENNGKREPGRQPAHPMAIRNINTQGDHSPLSPDTLKFPDNAWH